MRLYIIFSLLLSYSLSADTWKKELDEWKIQRVSNLTKPDGWLSLIGMEWLHAGENSIGAAAYNDIKLPHGPAYIGSFNLVGDDIIFTVNKGIEVAVNDTPLAGSTLVAMDSSGEPTIFKIDTFLFYVIERGKPALRIKDSKAETLKNFTSIEYFPISEQFRVVAEFIPYNPVKEVEIINILGSLSNEISPGKLSFKINDKNYTLDILDAGDEFYIIFADKTNGRSTYGPGRFIYIPKPQEGNMTVIDFNKSYNPPCAFTDYSTCPLPLPQNRLSVKIKAGEKKYK